MPPSYSSVGLDDQNDEPYQDEIKYRETAPLFQDTFNGIQEETRRRRRCNIWIATSALLFCVSIFQSWVIWGAIPKLRNYERGFKTDLKATWGEFDLHEVKFSGGLFYSENGTLEMSSPPPGEEVYVGPPSDKLDMAWAKLLFDTFGAISEDLVEQIPNSYKVIRRPETGTFEAGLDAMHTLHCVDMMRMSLDHEHYRKQGKLLDGTSYRLHMEHCINQLRQSVMCYGDATIMPLYWEPRAKRMMPYFDTTHTCRNFNSIRRWTDENIDGNDSKYIAGTATPGHQ